MTLLVLGRPGYARRSNSCTFSDIVGRQSVGRKSFEIKFGGVLVSRRKVAWCMISFSTPIEMCKKHGGCSATAIIDDCFLYSTDNFQPSVCGIFVSCSLNPHWCCRMLFIASIASQTHDPFVQGSMPAPVVSCRCEMYAIVSINSIVADSIGSLLFSCRSLMSSTVSTKSNFGLL